MQLIKKSEINKSKGFTLIELLVSLIILVVVSGVTFNLVKPVVARKALEWRIDSYLMDVSRDARTYIQTQLSKCNHGLTDNNLAAFGTNNKITISDIETVNNKNEIDGLSKSEITYLTEDGKKFNKTDYDNGKLIVPTMAVVTLVFKNNIEHSGINNRQIWRIGRDLGAKELKFTASGINLIFAYPILTNSIVGGESPLAFCDKNPYTAVH